MNICQNSSLFFIVLNILLSSVSQCCTKQLGDHGSLEGGIIERFKRNTENDHGSLESTEHDTELSDDSQGPMKRSISLKHVFKKKTCPECPNTNSNNLPEQTPNKADLAQKPEFQLSNNQVSRIEIGPAIMLPPETPSGSPNDDAVNISLSATIIDIPPQADDDDESTVNLSTNLALPNCSSLNKNCSAGPILIAIDNFFKNINSNVQQIFNLMTRSCENMKQALPMGVALAAAPAYLTMSQPNPFDFGKHLNDLNTKILNIRANWSQLFPTFQLPINIWNNKPTISDCLMNIRGNITDFSSIVKNAFGPQNIFNGFLKHINDTMNPLYQFNFNVWKALPFVAPLVKLNMLKGVAKHNFSWNSDTTIGNKNSNSMAAQLSNDDVFNWMRKNNGAFNQLRVFLDQMTKRTSDFFNWMIFKGKSQEEKPDIQKKGLIARFAAIFGIAWPVSFANKNEPQQNAWQKLFTLPSFPRGFKGHYDNIIKLLKKIFHCEDQPPPPSKHQIIVQNFLNWIYTALQWPHYTNCPPCSNSTAARLTTTTTTTSNCPLNNFFNWLSSKSNSVGSGINFSGFHNMLGKRQQPQQQQQRTTKVCSSCL